MIRRLGKLPVRENPLVPKLSTYMRAALGDAIETLPQHGWVAPSDWTTKVPPDHWPMFLNDALGCCTIATVGHIIEAMTSYTLPMPLLMAPDEVVSAYSRVGGYRPGEPTTDRGAVIMDVMEAWMRDGFQVAGNVHKIDGFVAINPMNMTEIKYAAQRFGNVVIGIELPKSAEAQRDRFEVTDFSLQGDAAIGSWGGHCVAGLKSDSDAVGVISWGGPMAMDWQFLQTYCTEMYSVIDTQDVIVDGLNRDGFTVHQLVADLERLRQGISVS